MSLVSFCFGDSVQDSAYINFGEPKAAQLSNFYGKIVVFHLLEGPVKRTIYSDKDKVRQNKKAYQPLEFEPTTSR